MDVIQSNPDFVDTRKIFSETTIRQNIKAILFLYALVYLSLIKVIPWFRVTYTDVNSVQYRIQ